MIIYLIGYMASGKSLVGASLAQKLQVPFYDLDKTIEAQNSRSISQIFSEEGEAAFRQKETKALQAISASRKAIVACGGGTFCLPQNRNWIKQHGIAIYLQVPPKVLSQRLYKNPQQRPLLQAHLHQKDALYTFVKKHLASREEDYLAADIIMKAVGKVEQIAEELAQYFERWGL